MSRTGLWVKREEARVLEYFLLGVILNWPAGGIDSCLRTTRWGLHARVEYVGWKTRKPPSPSAEMDVSVKESSEGRVGLS